MKALLYQGHGDVSVIQQAEVSSPTLKDGELRIEVKASGLNRADIVQRKGFYPPPPGASDIPGLEVAGVVREVGRGVSSFKVGDRVAALLAGGGYADEVTVDHGLVVELPSKMSFTEGAGLIEVFVTAHHNLFHLAGVREGQTALVHAGASGVGTAAIQLLKAAGVKCFVTVGAQEKAKFCETLGASAIDYKKEDFSKIILGATANQGVHALLDCIGAQYFKANLECLAVGGTMVLIGTMGGREAALDLGQLLRKRNRIIGSTLRGLPLEEKRRAVARFWKDFGPAVQSGKIHPVIDSVFPAKEVKAAQTRMESNLNKGKIVLSWE